jgi:hypothetical protein
MMLNHWTSVFLGAVLRFLYQKESKLDDGYGPKLERNFRTGGISFLNQSPNLTPLTSDVDQFGYKIEF